MIREEMMTLDEIKTAVESGKTVHWENEAYRVVKDSIGQWLVHCTINDHYVGLTTQSGDLREGEQSGFYIA
jgi:hypothetical protein